MLQRYLNCGWFVNLVYLQCGDDKQLLKLVNTKCDPKLITHITFLNTSASDLLIKAGMV